MKETGCLFHGGENSLFFMLLSGQAGFPAMFACWVLLF